MQKDAEKAHRLQEQLNEIQHVSRFDSDILLLKTDFSFYTLFDLYSTSTILFNF